MDGFRLRGRLQQATPTLLFALNLLIAWRLLNQEYTTHYNSIEPFFYAIAAHIRDHWLHPGWWGAWNCGMPFRYTYQPGLHAVTALLSGVTHWSTARAFHFGFALFYAAGPVTLFFLVRRLSNNYRIALTAALLYSLWSPSTWLIYDITVDTGGAFHSALHFGKQFASGWSFMLDTGGLLNARRLHTAVAYGDSPYVAGLTFVPLALLLIHRASLRPSRRNLFYAALGTVAVPLINIPATLSLVMALIAYFLSANPPDRIRRLAITAACGMAGYLLVAPLLPLSALALTAKNTQWMDPDGRFTPTKILLLTGGFILLYLISFTLRRLRVSEFANFSVLFALITGTIVLGRSWGGFSLVAQPTRFHLVMEMAIVMCLAALTPAIVVRKRWARIAVTALICCAVLWQIGSYRLYARKIVKREPVWNRSEYKIAKWLDRNASGQRVWVPGTVSFWFNTFTNTPQMTGCCDQNYLFQAPRIATYEMGTDDGAGARAGEISLVWMKALGVKYFALSGPRSTEEYHVTHHPAKFSGTLTSSWRDGDDAIYKIPGPTGSLAHFIRPGEVVQQMPVNGVEIAPLLPYVAALDNPARPATSFAWRNPEVAMIHGTANPRDVLSIQIPFHFGWRAESSSGSPIAIGQDGLGFMLLSPRCTGDCQVSLIFDGGLEAKLLTLSCCAAWAAVLLLMLRPRMFNNWVHAQTRV